MRRKHSYDVLIAGGGLAGLTLAALLGQAGVRVVCLDAAGPPTEYSDMRTTAISYGSRKILKRSGLWHNLQRPVCAIEDIKILDGSSPVLLSFLKSEMAEKSFGWICENADLKNAAVKNLAAFSSVTIMNHARVDDYQVSADDAQAILADGTKISARLIVGADGRHSFTREWMGVRTRSWAYNQTAVICSVIHQHPHHNVAVEHFWPGGPFAILPMANDEKGQHRSAVVFTEHQKPGATMLMDLSDTEFAQALAARFPDEYGDVRWAGQRAAYPLSLVHAASYTGPRMALVADAAHAIHPVAGQGLNLGFRDVAALAALVIAAHAHGDDVGSAALLQNYQRQRRFDVTSFVAVTDALVRLFGNDRPGLTLLRRAGLKAVARLPAAKRFFMSRAMGE